MALFLKNEVFMKRILGIILCALMIFTFCACSDDENEGGTLATPVVTVNESNVASWEAIKGAVYYEYQIGDEEPVRVGASTTKIQILIGEKIKVRAIGDGEIYFDGEWSAIATTTAIPQLPKPTLEAQVFDTQIIVTWKKDPRAISYEYRLNSDTDQPFDNDEVGLLITQGDKLYVRAKGDGVNYLDSDWAEMKK